MYTYTYIYMHICMFVSRCPINISVTTATKHAPVRNMEYICPKKNGLHFVKKEPLLYVESDEKGNEKDKGVTLFTMANNGNHFSICLCRTVSF